MIPSNARKTFQLGEFAAGRLPALLSTVAVGGAAAARRVVGELSPWLFLGSVFFLGYAHDWVWIRRRGHRASRWILAINTFLNMAS